MATTKKQVPDESRTALDVGDSSTINPSVPLPGSHVGRRLMALDLGLRKGDWLPSAFSAGRDFVEAYGIGQRTPLGADLKAAVGSLLGRSNDGIYKRALSSAVERLQSSAVAASLSAMTGGAESTSYDSIEQTQIDLSQSIQSTLARGNIPVPAVMWSGRSTVIEVYPTQPAKPLLLLVEIYGISSFLGPYGVGRTVKTFTLLPGEETKITMKTWRSSEKTIREGSSIIDSHEETAATKFGTQLQNETTDKSTRSSKENWHAEAEASCSWGFGSAKVSGGAGGEYQTGREEFAKQASNATQEHAASASAKRELSITASAEVTEKSGAEEVIERTIKNVNMRRVLNFVFRELNQQYEVKFHLKDVRVAFTNGRPDSYREVALSGMRGLLEGVLIANCVDRIAANLLKQVSVVFDENDTPVSVLEQIEMAPDGADWEIKPAVRVNGSFPPPDAQGTSLYRFKRGPLNQAGSKHPVDGVLMNTQAITMRTDSVIVEALLGASDALDAYAMQIQEAAADSKTLANDREKLLQDSLTAISDPSERAKVLATVVSTPLLTASATFSGQVSPTPK